MVYVIALSLVAGALGIYYLFFKDLNLFKKYGIPHRKPLPFVGNMAPSILHMESLDELIKKTYDLNLDAKYVGMYEFTIPIIVLRDPELIKSITLKHFEMFPDHRNFVEEDMDPLLSKNLFNIKGDKWREARAMLSPAFTSSKMKGMFKLMSDYAVNFAKFMAELPQEKKVIQTKDYLTRYTNDVIATCAFGVNVDSMRDPNNLFYVYSKKATVFDTTAFLKTYMYRIMPRLARIMKLKFIRQQVANFFTDLVEDTIKTRDEKGIVRPDMLQLMMESRSKKNLTIEDMTSQVFVFLIGGLDSTSTLMCFVAHEIAVNEEIRRKLQNEIDQVLEDTNGQAPYEAVNNMEYLDAVISEALRMYPIAVFVDRLCVKDFELPPTLPGTKPYIVKKGQAVWLPIYGLLHDPKHFKEPEKFDPNRFLGEEKKHVNNSAYVPFGLGPRMCIGNRFALLETKVLFFHLLARCDLLPCEKTPMPLKLAKAGFAVRPEGGFWVKVVPRKDPHRTLTVNNANETHDL